MSLNKCNGAVLIAVLTPEHPPKHRLGGKKTASRARGVMISAESTRRRRIYTLGTVAACARSTIGCYPCYLLLLLLLQPHRRAYLASVRKIALRQHVQVWQLELHHGAEAQQRPAHELGRVGDESGV